MDEALSDACAAGWRMRRRAREALQPQRRAQGWCARGRAGNRQPSPSARAGRYPGPIAELIHTCYRVLDLERSIAFYEALGFEELARKPIRDEATNCFMGLPGDGPRLELTHNHDVTEPYEIGTGYGHIAISVEDLDARLTELAELGIEPEKPPYRVREGGSRLCFVRDPDGYRIEIIER